jgi:hypothetical protein
MVKTSLAIPESLWLDAKRRALDERDSFVGIVVKALTLYLKTPPKPKR